VGRVRGHCLVGIALRALGLEINVVLDFGLWSRDERSALRQAAADVGASVVLCYFELAPEERRTRLDRGLADAPHETWPISDEDLVTYTATFDVPSAAELDGSEPIGPPPDGFASWGEWRRHRWPPFVR
jgi:predicted kinase